MCWAVRLDLQDSNLTVHQKYRPDKGLSVTVPRLCPTIIVRLNMGRADTHSRGDERVARCTTQARVLPIQALRNLPGLLRTAMHDVRIGSRNRFLLC